MPCLFIPEPILPTEPETFLLSKNIPLTLYALTNILNRSGLVDLDLPKQ